VIVLPDTLDRKIVSSFIWTKHRNVTDRQTDRQTDGQICRIGYYYSGLQWKQCGRAAKAYTCTEL